MSNLVPRFIIEKYARNEKGGRFHAVALFADISGFSVLTDQLMEHGRHGAEVLAGVMGSVFEPLIDAVYSQGGYVTGFAGDAFTAVFPIDGASPAHRALAAAVAIQEQMQLRPEYDTPYGRFPVSAKVGIATGDVIWGIVTSEDGQRASYYFQGTAVDGCAEAERAARPGEILLDSASYDAVRTSVTADAVGHHHRLTAVTTPLPAPRSDQPPPIDTEQLRPFVPRAVLRAGRTGEFRQVVNVFISLPTVRTEAQLDIFMKTVFNLQERYGGLLKQLDYGDKGAKLLLFWGAPVARENDVQRALHFILDLQTETAIPINGGLTYRVTHAGYIGSPLRGEYTCYGRGVNLAARFMSGAPRGEIWIDEDIARRAGGQFDLAFEGEKRFKGFARPQKVYVLFERTELADALYDGRLVGRESELARLKAFVAPIVDGHSPGIFVIAGEPGAGKSRLAYEFLTHHLQNGAETQVFLAQTDEIVRQSFNPFRYWLRHYFGQSKGLAASRNKRSFNRKLDHLIAETESQQLVDELDRGRSFLGALVGLHWPDSLYEQLDARGRHEHTLSGLSALLRAESRRRPAVLLLEDAQWIDQETSAFLTNLTRPQWAQVPLAIIATTRPAGESLTLEGVPYREMHLSALKPTDLADLAQLYLDAPPARNLRALLAEQSEGNPFFAEQILLYLQESGQLEKVNGHWRLIVGEESPLPRDVNALLLARLDRLDHDVREVVQTAAVLGREFEIRLLSAMLQGDEMLPSKVARAEQESVWSALSAIRYIFKHALLRDAAYRMQLHARRRALHKLALEALEHLFKDDLSGRLGELAYHALGAELTEPAFRYCVLAGNLAMGHYAAAEAVNHYRPAMERIRQVPSSAEQRRQLCTLYGRALELTGDPAAALVHYEEMEDLALELGDRPLQLAALVAKGTIRSTGNVMSDFELAESLGQEGLALAHSLDDSAAEAKIHWNLMQAYRLTGRYEDSLASGLRAFELAEAFDLREQMAYVANDLGTLYMGLGEIAEMVATSERAVALWRELENRPMLVDGLATNGIAKAMTGRFDDALAIAEEGIALSQASDNLWGEAFMRYTPALVHLQRMEIESGLANTKASIQLGREGGVTLVQFYAGVFQFLLYLAAKDYDQALASAGQALSIAEQHLSFQRPAAAGAMAIAHVELGELEKAKELIGSHQLNSGKPSMSLLMMPELARSWYLLAQGAYAELLPITGRMTEFAETEGITLLIPQFLTIQSKALLRLEKREAARRSVQSGLSLLRSAGARWGFLELAEVMSVLDEAAEHKPRGAE